MNWLTYHKLTKNKPPHPSLLKALGYVKNKDKALDIGSGGFRDAKYLLSKFKKVTAIDATINSKIPLGLNFKKTKFETFNFLVEEYDLINAQFSLPFLKKKDFLEVWGEVQKSLKANGIFVGQFFGNKDGWVGKNYSFFDKKQVEKLVHNFTILNFEEVYEKRKLASNIQKQWHYFEVILKKI